MKKFGVVLYKETDNFGDDIQTYVACRLLPHVDYIIDRENMDTFESKNHEPVFCIMNGWYLYKTINWPPSKDIVPLPISMHFTYSMLKYSSSKDLFILCLNRYFNHFSKYGLGCRDSSTLNLFKGDIKNIYLSYCLTLTLEKFDIPEASNEYICLVDVSDEVRDYVYQNANCEIKEYTHDYRNKTFEDISFEDRMKNVEERLKIYQNAKCVITSRYHAALPCLPLETPVILLPSNYEPSRFVDLDDLLCVCDEKEFITGNVFDINNPKENPKKYVTIAKKLKYRVNQFVMSDEKIEPYSELISFADIKVYLKKLEELSVENQNLKRILWADRYFVGESNVVRESNGDADILDNHDNRYNDLLQKYNSVIGSRSWKITSLYRKIGGVIKGVFNKVNLSFFKFLVVGGSSTLIDFVLYLFFSNYFDILFAKMISMSIASIYSFFLNRFWTFGSNDKSMKTKVLYFIVVIVNIIVNTLTNKLFYILTNQKIIAFIIATGIAMIVNYILQKYVVFKEEK